MGMIVLTRADGSRAAEACECQHERRILQMHRRVRIPERYRLCTLESYSYNHAGADPSLWHAFNQARGFVNGYPATTNGNGLLLTGHIVDQDAFETQQSGKRDKTWRQRGFALPVVESSWSNRQICSATGTSAVECASKTHVPRARPCSQLGL